MDTSNMSNAEIQSMIQKRVEELTAQRLQEERASLNALQAELNRKQQALTAQQESLLSDKRDLDKDSRSVEKQSSMMGRKVGDEIAKKEAELTEVKRALKAKEKELARQLKLIDKKVKEKLSERTKALEKKEKELQRRSIQIEGSVKKSLASQEQDLNNKKLALENREREAAERIRELQAKVDEEISFKQKELDSKRLELEAKERSLAEQNSKLSNKVEIEFAKREKEIILREKEKLESVIKRKEQELQEKLRLKEQEIPRIVEKVREDVRRKQEELDKKQAELNRQQALLNREQNVFSTKQQELASKEKSWERKAGFTPQEEYQEVKQDRRSVEPIEDQDWLTTYSDVITLILTMFVLMFSLAKVDQEKFEEIKKSIDISLLKKGGPTVLDASVKGETILGSIKQRFKKIFEENNLDKAIKMDLGAQGLKLELPNKSLYPSGTANVKPEMFPILRDIADAIKKTDLKNYTISVEGHTDDTPIHTVVYPSNWELSAARATNIVRFFIDEGIDPYLLRATGYADSRPKVPNLDDSGKPIPGNRDINRRVVIFIEDLKK